MDEQTATENVKFLCFILQEKTQENLMGGGGGWLASIERRPFITLLPILLPALLKPAGDRNWKTAARAPSFYYC